jgi:hypothetical protein
MGIAVEDKATSPKMSSRTTALVALRKSFRGHPPQSLE